MVPLSQSSLSCLLEFNTVMNLVPEQELKNCGFDARENTQKKVLTILTSCWLVLLAYFLQVVVPYDFIVSIE